MEDVVHVYELVCKADMKWLKTITSDMTINSNTMFVVWNINLPNKVAVLLLSGSCEECLLSK